jgi:hypothetical protein
MAHVNSFPSSKSPIDIWYSRCGAATASALAIRKGWLQAEFSQADTVLHSLRDSDDRVVLDSHYHHQLSGLFRDWIEAEPLNEAVKLVARQPALFERQASPKAQVSRSVVEEELA